MKNLNQRAGIFLAAAMIPAAAWPLGMEGDGGALDGGRPTPAMLSVPAAQDGFGGLPSDFSSNSGIPAPGAVSIAAPAQDADGNDAASRGPQNGGGENGLNAAVVGKAADLVSRLPNQRDLRTAEDGTPIGLALFVVGRDKIKLLQIYRGDAVVWVDVTHMAIDPDDDQTGSSSGMTPEQAAAFVNKEAAQWLKILAPDSGAAPESARRQPSETPKPPVLPKSDAVSFDGEKKSGDAAAEAPQEEEALPKWMTDAAVDILKNGPAAVKRLTAEQKEALIRRIDSSLKTANDQEYKRRRMKIFHDDVKSALDEAVKKKEKTRKEADDLLARACARYQRELDAEIGELVSQLGYVREVLGRAG